jgi:hypothetical protein
MSKLLRFFFSIWTQIKKSDWGKKRRKIDNLGGIQVDLWLIKMGLVLADGFGFLFDEKLNYKTKRNEEGERNYGKTWKISMCRDLEKIHSNLRKISV